MMTAGLEKIIIIVNFDSLDLWSSQISKIELQQARNASNTLSLLKCKAGTQLLPFRRFKIFDGKVRNLVIYIENIKAEKSIKDTNRADLQSIIFLSSEKDENLRNVNKSKKMLNRMTAAKQLQVYRKRNSYSFGAGNHLTANPTRIVRAKRLNSGKEHNDRFVKQNSNLELADVKINNFQENYRQQELQLDSKYFRFFGILNLLNDMLC